MEYGFRGDLYCGIEGPRGCGALVSGIVGGALK